MTSENKISIIVPVYNIEKYIERCLDSILNQTYKNIEIIFVDDGSNDNSGRLLDCYKIKDDRIRVIHKQNGGVTSARIRGIKEATGDWIGFVDGDDVIDSDMFSFLMKNALKYDADISHCGYKIVFEDNRVHYFYNTKSIIIQDNIKGIKDLLEGTIVEPALWNKLYKKELFDNFSIDTTIKINEDLLMNYYLFKKAKRSVFNDQCKYSYFVRKNSSSRQKLNENKIYDPIKVKTIIMSDVNDRLLPIVKKVYIRTILNVYNSLILEKSKEFNSDKNNIYNLIKKNKQYIPYLDKRQKLLSYMIVFLPKTIYKKIYQLYVNKFQKKVYE